MEICKSNKCTGCGGCVDICPKGCVELITDKDGFYTSLVNENACVNCGLCKKICPGNTCNNSNAIKKAYKARRKNIEEAQKSTSGGIAAVISEYVIRNSGVVIGCGFDENVQLRHCVATNLKQIEKFKGSKYQQSNVVGVYKEAKIKLLEGKTVAFIGTPCQVAALKNYLGRDYENLYLIDFVCHGVPSQKVLDKYIKSLKIKNITDISYRNKDDGYGPKTVNNVRVYYENGLIESTVNSGVGLWFVSSLSIRKSCYNCNFVSTNRCSDITLADYIGNDLTEDEIACGVSTIFINTEKGDDLINSIKSDLYTTEREILSTTNSYLRLNNKTKVPKCRKKFFKDIDKLSYEQLTQKYTLKRILSNIFVRKLRSVWKRINNKIFK